MKRLIVGVALLSNFVSPLPSHAVIGRAGPIEHVDANMVLHMIDFRADGDKKTWNKIAPGASAPKSHFGLDLHQGTFHLWFTFANLPGELPGDSTVGVYVYTPYAQDQKPSVSIHKYGSYCDIVTAQIPSGTHEYTALTELKQLAADHPDTITHLQTLVNFITPPKPPTRK